MQYLYSMKKALSKGYKVLHVVTSPVNLLVDNFHNIHRARIFKHKKHAKVAMGVVIMMTGSALGMVHVEFLPMYIWHGLTGLLHAYGSLPVLKVVTEKLNIESFEEQTERRVQELERRANEKA